MAPVPHRVPAVERGLLRFPEGQADGPSAAPPIAVGSPAWFAWLGGEAARSFAFRSPAGGFTANREARGRGGAYWYAYRKAGGHRRKAYLGRAEDLTPQRLAGVAAELARPPDTPPARKEAAEKRPADP